MKLKIKCKRCGSYLDFNARQMYPDTIMLEEDVAIPELVIKQMEHFVAHIGWEFDVDYLFYEGLCSECE